MEELNKTILNEWHKKKGAKMVGFAGYEMPILYEGLIPEHNNVRQNVGLFDVSHMGVIYFEGEKSLDFLQYVTSNDVSKIKPGRAQYNALMREDGGLVDDIIVYCTDSNNYFAIVNASNIKKDFKHFNEHNDFNVKITNKSEEYSLIALQGPKAKDIFSELALDTAVALRPFGHVNVNLDFNGIKINNLTVARTGYTGEDGFEILVKNESGLALWQLLMEVGSKFNILPIGLGARDTLRLEACYSLYGHELGEDISLIESDLGWICKCDKPKFLGKDIVCNEKVSGAKRKLVAFEVLDRGIVREDTLITFEGNEIGKVTSGTKTPTINKAIGLALIATEHAVIEKKLSAIVRNKPVGIKVVNKPFYKKPNI